MSSAVRPSHKLHVVVDRHFGSGGLTQHHKIPWWIQDHLKRIKKLVFNKELLRIEHLAVIVLVHPIV